MGAGASHQAGNGSAQLDHNADKWKGLIGELESICKEHQANIAKTSLQANSHSPKGDDTNLGRKRGSSILKKDSMLVDKGQPKGEMPRNRSSSVIIHSDAARTNSGPPRPLDPEHMSQALECLRSPTSTTFSENLPSPMSTTKQAVRKPRSFTMKLKKQRKTFYETYIDGEFNPAKEISCRYLGLMCAALSFLLEANDSFERSHKRLTVEDMFFETHLPLHYLDIASLTLSNLRDIAQEFINHDPRCRGIIKVDAVHMESTLAEGEVEQGEQANESGDRGPMSLSDFRKSIEEEFKEMSSCRIFSYDPYVVEQAQLRVDDSESDSDANEGDANAFNGTLTVDPNSSAPSQSLDALARYKHAPESRFGPTNDGWFSLASDFNSATNTITLADAKLDQDIHLEEHQTPLQALYRGCCTRDRYTSRCRGYLQFSLINETTDEDEVKVLYPSDLNNGYGHNGIPLISVRPVVSKHLVALAYGLHLIRGFVSQESGQGINIREPCKELDFPLSVVTNYDMPLLEAFAYYEQYLKHSDLGVWAVPQPIDKKVESADSPPNMSMMGLHEILVRATTESADINKVMILQFDLAAVHNVLNIAPPGMSHYGILQSYDPEKQQVEILDVEPVKYGRQWSTTLPRLHRALIGKGYIFLYKSSVVSLGDGSTRLDELQVSVRRVDTLTSKRLKNLKMKPMLPPDHIMFFEYPVVVTPVTTIAIAMNLLRPSKVVLTKDVVYCIDTDPSFLVDEKISLNDVQRIAACYLVNSGQNDEISAECVNFDEKLNGERRVTLAQFEETLLKSASRNEVIIINCSTKALASYGGGKGGEYLVLHSVITEDQPDPIVCVSDAHKRMYTRYNQIPLSELYAGCLEHDPLSGRARGYLRVSLEPLPDMYTSGHSISMFSLPQWEQFRVPQCTHLNGTALALTTLGHRCSVEEMFYTAYTSLGGERYRRGSSVFPWHSMKINMSELSEKMTVTAVAKMVMKFEQATNHCLTTSIVIGSSKEDFELLLQEAAELRCKFFVVVVVNTGPIFDMALPDDSRWKLGCGIIKDYDPNTRTVYVVDANPTRYGSVWSVDVDVLYGAADLDSSDKGENGLIKIGKTQTGIGAKRKSIVEADFLMT